MRTAVAASALAVGLGDVAAGQESPEPSADITTTAVVTDQEEYEQDLLGFWIHLANELDPYEASVADECEQIDWSDQEAMAFDARLIDRTAEPETARLTVFIHDEVDVDPGELFIINEVHPCENQYLSLRIEQIGADAIGVGPAPAPATDTGTTEGVGPGLGVPAAGAALLGGGWLARRFGAEED